MAIAVLWDESELEFPSAQVDAMRKALKNEKFVTIGDRTMAVSAIREIRDWKRKRLTPEGRKKLDMAMRDEQEAAQKRMRQEQDDALHSGRLVWAIHRKSGMRLLLKPDSTLIDGDRCVLDA